jgi:signal transduction histidine kinase
LTKPVRHLRNASNELANGNLDVRVGALMGHSKDELTDLGHDFDYMAEKLQLLMKKQQQLLQNISHELRSPLARIHLAMGLAKKKNCGDVSLDLNRIELETNRLECLIAEVLTLARQEDGNISLVDEYIDVAELLKFIVADAEYEAENKNCHVGFTCDVTPIIQANGELLRRALENIIRNAVKYTVEASTISVVLKTNTQKEVIEIAICDQGRGVPAEFLSSLFEPFVRVADSRDRDSGGYGLGLAISQHAIELHGGNVRAKNRESGGLCVEVRLPIHR